MVAIPGPTASTFLAEVAPARKRRILRFLPYALAAVLGFAVLLSFGLGREGGAARMLVGPDDFMRVVQVLDWVDGQGWNDMVQRRVNPPAGVDMHWSRLADLPLTAVITLAEPLQKLPASLGQFPLELRNGGLEICYRGGDGTGKGREEVAELTKALSAAEIDYKGIDIHDSSLEDIFVGLLNEEEAA